MKVIFCGFGRAGLECFYQLVANYNLNTKNIIVFTHDVKENECFIKHLNENNINYSFSKINDCYELLSNFSPNYLISIYYRYIIKKNILEIVDYKAMNSHPSLLPKYRGTKSSVWAILNGEVKTGITYHYINEKIDDGNIILQKKLEILDNDTAYSLYNKLISLFVANFCNAFDKLQNKDLGYKQRGAVSYYKRELPFGGIMKFEDVTFSEAKLFVRSMYFPPYTGAVFLTKNGKKVEIKDLKDLHKYKNILKK